MSRSAIVAACLVTSLWTSAAHALEAQASLDHTSEYGTNTERVAADGTKEWVHTPGFTIGANQNTATIDLLGNYRYRRRIYTDSEFSNEDITTGRGSVIWRAIPNRLDFFANNSRSESTRQAIGADSPDNRQVVSNSDAGANLRLQPRRGDELTIGYSYVVNTQTTTNNDSQRHVGTASYRVGISPSRNVTLLGTYADISYDDFANATATTTTLGYSEVRDDYTVDVSAGYSWFDRDGRDTVDGGVYTASLNWIVTGASSLGLTASRQIVDQSQGFFGRQDFDDTLAENSFTNEVLTETRNAVTWNQQFGANNFSFTGFTRKQEYEDIDADNEQVGVGASFSRSIRRNTTLTTSVSFENREFDQQDDEQDQVRASFRVNHVVGRKTRVFWGGRYEDRDTDNTEDFDLWSVSVGFSYALLGPRGR